MARQALGRLRPTPRSDTDVLAARPPHVAVVGVGQEINGDDAAGVKVAQALLKRQRAGSSNAPRPAAFSLLVVEAAHAPENCLGAIRRFSPDLVILVDAAEMGDPPGTVRWLDWRDTCSFGTSTHTLSLSVMARYLAAELGCEIGLIGIQAGDTSFGAPMSPAVRQAARAVAHGLASLLVPSAAPDIRSPR
jgi:hydrogenase 3 maturation protease